MTDNDSATSRTHDPSARCSPSSSGRRSHLAKPRFRGVSGLTTHVRHGGECPCRHRRARGVCERSPAVGHADAARGKRQSCELRTPQSVGFSSGAGFVDGQFLTKPHARPRLLFDFGCGHGCIRKGQCGSRPHRPASAASSVERPVHAFVGAWNHYDSSAWTGFRTPYPLRLSPEPHRIEKPGSSGLFYFGRALSSSSLRMAIFL